MLKKDNIWLGVVIGLLLPSLALLVIQIIKYYVIVLAKDDLPYILCAALNLLIVRYLLHKNKEQTARGVVGATFVCALAFMIYKWSRG